VTPKRGGDSELGKYDIGGDYNYIARKNAEYDVDSTVVVKSARQEQINKPGAY
jgi:hypothetical protein